MEREVLSLLVALTQLPDDDLLSYFVESLNTLQHQVICAYLPENETATHNFEPITTTNHCFGTIAFDDGFTTQPESFQTWMRNSVRLLAQLLENRALSGKNLELQANLNTVESQVGTLFDQFPLSLWEEDFSQVKAIIDELRKQGVEDFRTHFNTHPEDLNRCIEGIVIKNVNQNTLHFYHAASKEEFMATLNNAMGRSHNEVLLEEFIAIAEGHTTFSMEGQADIFEGEIRYDLVLWLVYPGCEQTFKRVIVAVSDITEHRHLLDALRESEERYSLAVRGANDGNWDWDLRSEKVYFSPRWKAMLGYSESEIGESIDEWMGRIHPDDIAHILEDMQAHLSGLTTNFTNEHRIWTRFGNYRWFLARGIAVREEGQKPHRIAGSLTDINPRKLIEDRLMHDAMHDPLTNLPNRTYFIDQLRHCIERSKRHPDYQAAVLFLDLDRFRIVNESLGHASGDRMLMGISNRLQKCVRGGDTIARFSGDDFAILLEDVNGVADATRIANHIQQELTNGFDLKGQEVFTTASIGIVLLRSNYQTPEEMLRDAETALSRAKSSGRSRYQIFDSKMHAQSLTLLQMEADMRRAIEREEFVIHYQPIVSLTTGQITCVEALVRWQNPERGLVLPNDFIPYAEESGLILPIGEWILRKACAQAKSWRDIGFKELSVAINISPRQFQDQNLLELVESVIKETGVAPNAIQLEITESAAMVDLDMTVRILQEMNRKGIRVSIDDFGASYSSLGYLKRFPIHTLKIDLSFILDIPQSANDAAITTAMIAMGHILDLGVVSEGVETSEQLEFLISRQCDEVQGHLLAGAMLPDEITRLLNSGLSLLPQKTKTT